MHLNSIQDARNRFADIDISRFILFIGHRKNYFMRNLHVELHKPKTVIFFPKVRSEQHVVVCVCGGGLRGVCVWGGG